MRDNICEDFSHGTSVHLETPQSLFPLNGRSLLGIITPGREKGAIALGDDCVCVCVFVMCVYMYVQAYFDLGDFHLYHISVVINDTTT